MMSVAFSISFDAPVVTPSSSPLLSVSSASAFLPAYSMITCSFNSLTVNNPSFFGVIKVAPPAPDVDGMMDAFVRS